MLFGITLFQLLLLQYFFVSKLKITKQKNEYCLVLYINISFSYKFSYMQNQNQKMSILFQKTKYTIGYLINSSILICYLLIQKLKNFLVFILFVRILYSPCFCKSINKKILIRKFKLKYLFACLKK